jgi:hypothetical protein
MKKVTAILLCMTVCGAALFAQEEQIAQEEQTKKPKSLFSAGGGLILVPGSQTMKPKGGGEEKTSSFGGGINAFFDATYAEVNVSLIFGSTKDDGSDAIDTTDLILGAVGKYPISLNPIVLFPFIGIDYRINLAASHDGEEADDDFRADYFNALSLLFGVGVDYNITSALYLRGELGYGIIFNSKYEDDIKDYIDSNVKGKVPIKIAVGYRF